jgi:hypothetical protein
MKLSSKAAANRLLDFLFSDAWPRPRPQPRPEPESDLAAGSRSRSPVWDESEPDYSGFVPKS